MAECLTLSDRVGSIADHAPLWKDKASRLAGIAGLPFAATLGQVATELLGLTVFGIDVTVDRLMADPLAMAFVTQASSNLLGRPAVFQPLDHGEAQAFVPDQLALPRPARCGQTLRIHVPISRRHRHFGIVPEIAPDLAMDGRSMPAELDRDLRHADLAVQQPGDDPALIKGEMRCQEGFSSICNCLKTMTCRVSKWNPPSTRKKRDKQYYVILLHRHA